MTGELRATGRYPLSSPKWADASKKIGKSSPRRARGPRATGPHAGRVGHERGRLDSPCLGYPNLLDDTSCWRAFPVNEAVMIPIDFSGKVALVTGVGDSDSFAWFISKGLQSAGAKLVWAVHPRMMTIVEGFLKGQAPEDLASRQLPHGKGSLTVEQILPCDVSYDTMA